MQTLTNAGASADTFAVSAGINFNGTINGRSAADDILDYSNYGTSHALTYTVNGTASGTVSDTVNTTAFASIGTLKGSTGTNNFNIQSGSLSNLTSGTGTNTLTDTAGTLGSVTFNGPVQINSSAVTTTGSQTYNSNVTLTTNTMLTSTGSSSSILFNGSGNTLTGGTNTLNVSVADANSAINSQIVSLGGLTKSGAGTLTISNNTNTYTGATTITDGTLNVTAVNGLGTGSATISVTPSASNTASLDLNSLSSTLGETGTIALNSSAASSEAELMAAGTYTLGNAVSFSGTTNNTVDVSSGDVTLGGGISGAGTMTVNNGSGAALTLNTANTSYTGATQVNGGILSVTNVSGLGNASGGPITVNAGTLSLGLGGHPLSNNASTITLNGAGVGGIGSSALYDADTTGTENIANPVTLGSAAAIGVNSGSTLNVSNFNSAGFNLALNGGGSMNLTSSAALQLATSSIGNVTLNTGALTQAGALTVSGTSSFSVGAHPITLTQNNSFGGAVTVSNSGSNNVALTSSGALQLAASTVGQNLTVISGGAITQTGALTVPGTSSFNAGANDITLTNSANHFSGAVSLASTATNNANPPNSYDVNVTNSAALTLGTIAVNDMNVTTTAGDITIGTNIPASSWTSSGTYNISAYANVNVNAAIANTNSGVLILTSDNTQNGTGTINGSGSINMSGAVASPNNGHVDFHYNAPLNFTNVTVSGTTVWNQYSYASNLFTGTAANLTGTVNLIDDGTFVTSAPIVGSGANNNYTLRFSNTVVSGDSLLVYISGGSLANGVTLYNGSAVSGVNLYPSTITAGSDAAAQLSTTNLITALNGYSSAGNILYGVTAPHLILNSGIQLRTTPHTTFILNGNITGTAAQTYYGPVQVGAATVTLAASTSDIHFMSTVNSVNTASNNLILSTSGQQIFDGLVGNTYPLNTLTTDAGTVTINGGGITTNTSQTYESPVILGTNAQLKSGGAITFDNTVSGSTETLMLQDTSGTYTGPVTFNNNVTLNSLVTYGQNYAVNFLAPTSANTITITTATTFNNTNGVTLSGGDTFNFTNGLTSIAGTTTLNGTINTTNSAITLGDNTSLGVGHSNQAITLANDTTLSPGSGQIILNGTVNGTYALTLDSSTANIINNTVGINSLTLKGGGRDQINTASITTTNSQTYDDSVVLNANTTWTSADITASGPTIGGPNNATLYALTLSNSGTNSTIASTLQNLSSFTKEGTGTLTLSNTANTYTGQTFINDGTLQVTHLAIANSPSSLGASANPIQLGNGSTSSTVTLLDLDTVSFNDSTIVISNPNNNRAILFTGNVLLRASGALASEVSVNSSNPASATVSNDLTLTAPTMTLISINATSPLAIHSITSTSGTTLHLQGAITTTGDQTYNGLVVLDNNLSLTSNTNLSLNGGVTGGAHTLTLTETSGNNHVFTLEGSLNFSTFNSANITIVGDSTAASNTLSLLTNDTSIVWNTSGTNSGTITPVKMNVDGSVNAPTSTTAYGITFSTIQNLTGGTAQNTFVINDASNIASIDGGSGLHNTLDYYYYQGGSVTIDLATYSASNISNGVYHIQSFIGSATNNASNQFIGMNWLGSWMVTAPTDGSYTAKNTSYSFANFPNVASGTAGGVFTFTPQGSLNTVTGGATSANNSSSTPYAEIILPNQTNSVDFGSNVTSGTLALGAIACSALGTAGGCVNDPIQFSGVNAIYSTSGTDRFYFNNNTADLVDRTNATVTIDNLLIHFYNVNFFASGTINGYTQEIVGSVVSGAIASMSQLPEMTMTSEDGDSLIEGKDNNAVSLLKKAAKGAHIEQNIIVIQDQQSASTSAALNNTQIQATPCN